MGVELKDNDSNQKLETTIITKNKSFSFLLPLYRLRNLHNILNTYLGDVEEDLFNSKLYILCSKENNFIDLNENFIKKYEVKHGIMYILYIPDNIKQEYELFLKGKYSKFKESSKEYLCNHACRNSEKKPHQTQMYSILYRTKNRKEEIEAKLDVKLSDDAEYASIFNEELEIYGL